MIVLMINEIQINELNYYNLYLCNRAVFYGPDKTLLQLIN